MNIKSLVPVRCSSFWSGTGKRRGLVPSTFLQRRCMAVHVGTGETGRIERRRDNNMELVLSEKKREKESESNSKRENELQIGFHYEELLRSDPLNPLLLRNYGQFLLEVVGDVEKAEECYERAILESRVPDGELLAQYGKLLWEKMREKERAERYMETAVQASPHDCYVAGAYAHFLWDSEEEENDQNPIS